LIANLLKDDRYFLISTGGMLRDEIKRQTVIGKKVEGLVKAQTLVDESIIWDLVVNTLRSEKASGKHFIIFEGFPRNVDQAKKLDQIAVLQKAISVRADQSVVNQRLKTA
jgi:adenylate kinase